MPNKKKLIATLTLLLISLTIPSIITGNSNDRRLDAWYATYNHMYFQDRLPKTTVITRNLTDDRFMAQTFYENDFYHIAINPRFNESRKTEKLNLLHESCHIEVFINKEEDEFDDHGEHWQRCMHRLADEKAFEQLW